MFLNHTVDAIYASHVLEHISYRNELTPTLNEWVRVLKPGGVAMIAVPDLSVLSKLFLNETLSLQQRFEVTRMIFGGQVDNYDYHKAGFDYKLLASILNSNGFCRVRKVNDFKLFRDTSTLRHLGVPISLNVIARVCTKQPVSILELEDHEGNILKIN